MLSVKKKVTGELDKKNRRYPGGRVEVEVEK